MGNQIQVFDNAEFGSVRAIEIDNEPWFVGKDCAVALGYKDHKNALKLHVDGEDKRGWQITTPGGTQTMTIINEGGLYSLAVRSNMPNAKKFTRWLTHDVAISIRKTGSYKLPSGDPRAALTPTVLRQLADHIESLETQVAELTPDAVYCRNVLQSPDTMPITLIAKEYGMSGITLNRILMTEKIIRKVGDTYVLNQPYAALGYAETETLLTHGGVRKQLKWTEKGRRLIHTVLTGKYATNRERQRALPALF